jgi:hypothetical protein
MDWFFLGHSGQKYVHHKNSYFYMHILHRISRTEFLAEENKEHKKEVIMEEDIPHNYTI